MVTAVRRLPAAPAMYAPMPEALDRRLVGALATRGIRELYTHQAETMAHALAGRSTVVVTPTASGKTLCFNGPVLDAILKDPSARALYLYPTKALAQDQLAELHGLVELIDAQAGQGRRRESRPRSACSPTTATRRRTPAAPSAPARTSC